MLSETSIQDALYDYRLNKSDQIIIPNTGMAHGHESDLVVVTNSFLTHEFEIKISRSDWLSEMSMKSDSKRVKHENMQAIDETIKHRKRYNSTTLPPNYFWVVCPEGVVKDELPEYAGLLIVKVGRNGDIRFKQEKRAPRLHKEKLDAQTFIALSRGLMFRYWQNRAS